MYNRIFYIDLNLKLKKLPLNCFYFCLKLKKVLSWYDIKFHHTIYFAIYAASRDYQLIFSIVMAPHYLSSFLHKRCEATAHGPVGARRNHVKAHPLVVGRV
jgi:hypothetical protein